MPSPLLKRLRERKLFQWAAAYLAGAFVVFQAVEVMAEPWGISPGLQRAVHVVLVLGLFITLVLAWYHGEKGRQGVSGPELLIIALLLLISGGVLSMLGTGEEEPEQARPPGSVAMEDDRPSVAVLPCDNLSVDPADEYLATALHDEILLKLQGISSLFSTGRASVEWYAENPAPLPQVAQELGVGFVGECSVQKYGEQIRLIFQLLDGSTGGHVWAEDYIRDLTIGNLFDIQSDIAQRVAHAIGAALTPEEQDRIEAVHTGNQEAYDLYLQAMTYLNRPEDREDDLSLAQGLLEQAIRLDPAFALALSRLSIVHGRMNRYGHDLSPERLRAQKSAADSALTLEPDLPQAYLASGYVHYIDRDFPSALEDYHTALEGLPNDVEIIANIGYSHRRLGDWSEVFAAYERVVALSPRSADLHGDLGGKSFLVNHRYQEAIDALNRGLQLTPDDGDAAFDKAVAYVGLEGQMDTLLAVARTSPGLSAADRIWLCLYARDSECALSFLDHLPDSVLPSQDFVVTKSLFSAFIHHLKGDEATALHAFDSARVSLEAYAQEKPDDHRVNVGLGFVYAGLGRKSDASQSAERFVVAAGGEPYSHLFNAGDAAEVLGFAGLADECVDLLRPLLEGPSYLSVNVLKTRWTFDPVRDHPRFQALLQEYGDDLG